MKAPVASLKILGQRDAGALFEIIVEVGAPRQIGAEPEEWVCLAEIRPLEDRPFEAHGVSSLQAISLALRSGIRSLENFTNIGGRLFYKPGKAFDLGPYLVTLSEV